MGKAADKENRRKLSAAETKRLDKYTELKAGLCAEGYEERDMTVSLVFANVMAFVLTLPIIAVFVVLFFIKNIELAPAINERTILGVLLFLVLLAALVVLHELIHGLTWAVFAKNHWKAISFGFIAEYLTPYCTCGEPLKRGQYIIGALMPTILLGIVPSVIAIFTGSHFLLGIGSLMIMSGGGDLTIVLKLLLRKENGKQCVYVDHPYKVGLMVFER